MPRVIRNTLLSMRDLMATVGPFVLVALALLVGAYFVMKPSSGICPASLPFGATVTSLLSDRPPRVRDHTTV